MEHSHLLSQKESLISFPGTDKAYVKGMSASHENLTLKTQLQDFFVWRAVKETSPLPLLPPGLSLPFTQAFLFTLYFQTA